MKNIVFHIFIGTIALKIFVLAYSTVLPEKSKVELKHIVFKMVWTWVAGFKRDLSEAKDNNHNLQNPVSTFFLLGTQKTSFQNIRVSR